MGNASVLAFFLRVVLGIAVWARLVRASLKKLENLTSSGEEPHCPPLTAGLLASLSLSLSPSLGDHSSKSTAVDETCENAQESLEF